MSAPCALAAAARWSEVGAAAIAGLLAETTARWPYSRAPDAALAARFAEEDHAEHRLAAVVGGRVVAVVHGERDGEEHRLLLVAALPDAVAQLAALIGAAVADARRAGLRRVRGPHHAGGAWYGGYVCGAEPYLPHAALAETEAFVRAGFRIAHAAVVLVSEPGTRAPAPPLPAGYELSVEPAPPEAGARTFRCVARAGGREAAFCGARLYDGLIAGGAPVGQLGHVATDAAHRGRGLATALVADALDRLRAMGGGDVLIATGLDNVPALRAYERAGFVRSFPIHEWSLELPTG